MSENWFDIGVYSAFQQLEQLSQQVEDLPAPHRALLDEVIKAFSASVKVLQAAANELQHKNAELEAERRRYQDLFEFAPDGYLVTDPAGIIREANRAAVDLLGVARLDLIGTSFARYAAKEDQERFDAHLNHLLDGGKDGEGDTEWELRIQPQDGATFPAALTVAPIHSAAGKLAGLRWLVRDVTSSQREEERQRLILQIQEDRAALQELTSDLAWEREIQDKIMENTTAHLAYLDADFYFLRVNATYARGSGYTKEELIGRNHFDLFPHAENQAIFEQVRATGEPAEFHAKPFEYPDDPVRGVTYWDWTLTPVKGANGQVQGLVFSLLDVTENIRANEALHKREKEFRTLTGNLPDIVARFDRDLRHIYVNPAIERAAGQPPETFIGKTNTEVGMPAHLCAFWDEYLLGVWASGQEAEFEFSFERDDDERYYHTRLVPEFAPDGSVESVLSIARDITERRRTRHALRRTTERLRILYEVDQAILAARSPAEIADAVLPYVRHLTNCVRTCVVLFNPEGTDASLLSVQADAETQLSEGQCVSTEVVWPLDILAQGRIQIVEDIQGIAASTPVLQILREEGVRAFISLPLIAQGDLIGALNMGLEAPGRPTVEQMNIAREMANQLAIGIQQANLHAKVQSHADDLEKQVTQRTAALRASEERFRQLAENINQVFWMTDLANHEFLYISRAYQDLWGQLPQTLYERPAAFFEAMHPEDRERMRAATRRGGQAEQLEEFRLERPDGSQIWVRARTFPVRDAHGRAYRVAGIAEDITDQVEALRLLEQHVEERTRQLSTLLEIASGMTLTLELGPLLDLILDGLQTVVEYDSAVVYELEEESLIVLAHRGSGTPEGRQHTRIRLPESALARQALADREPTLILEIPNKQRDGLLAPVADWACCGLAAPLTIKEKVIGLLVIYSIQSRPYSSRQARLVMALANQAAVGIENAFLYKQAQALAVIEERQRLARDLHDAVSQTLFSANIIAEALPRIWERDPDGAQRRLPQLHNLTRGALAEMRTLLLELRPTALVEVDLSELLQQAVDAFSGRTRTVASLVVTGRRPLPEDVQVALYRIAQEALNNVAKHAKATEATIHLKRGPAGIELYIRDNGQGFDPDGVPPGHMGLTILRERARAIGATLEIVSQPGDGTDIVVVWNEME